MPLEEHERVGLTVCLLYLIGPGVESDRRGR